MTVANWLQGILGPVQPSNDLPARATSFLPDTDGMGGADTASLVSGPSPGRPSTPLPAQNTNLFGLSPQTANAIGLFGAGLSDAGAYLSGHPDNANSLFRYQMMQQKLGQQRDMRQAMGDLANATDPQAQRAAAMRVRALGGDLSGFSAAQKFGRPELRDLPKNGLAVIDPATGLPSSTIGVPTQLPQKPLISGGMISRDNGNTWQAIPGYVDNQLAIAGAKRVPKAAPAGMINIPHPSSRF